MEQFKAIFFLASVFFCAHLSAQNEVPILDYEIDVNGQARFTVQSTVDHYYVLYVRHDSEGEFTWTPSVTFGEEGTTVLTEPLEAYPVEHYKVVEFSIDDPQDIDNDTKDDVSELTFFPQSSPVNAAQPIDLIDGSVGVSSLLMFKELSVADEEIGWAPFLNDKEFVKFVTVDLMTDHPQIYFVNSETHYIHADFIFGIGIDDLDTDIKGEIIYHPTTVANNGTLGVFSFNYSFGDYESFEVIQRTQELIAANMPFVKNNLSYFITGNNESDYEEDIELFENSRVPALLESDVFADIDYLALNIAEGFGFFRLMDLDETPGSKDIVLYESLPNTLPRVGGIMTSFIQTPLSHVNLRAIQDNVPNAFIRDPLTVDSIANLIDSYIYYRVDQDEYFIRSATLEEVNEWYEDLRPDEEQIPPLNLSYTSILPLDEIDFTMADGFGAKCCNVATMRNFGFPEGTIPDGYGIPFYFYQEFMAYNNLYDQVNTMFENESFETNLDVRIALLAELRDSIRAADMPNWMWEELQDLQDSFPEGTSIRCRSSTNNEDLPGFSGAGLYTSKTQHPEEGHISKSVKQVYASIWNFRAFDERDFYRIDQYVASMGILCHPNYVDEKANGVGVSLDPIYQTDDTFYLNTQLGEDLVTNPDALSVPEEILLDEVSLTEDDYVVIRYSNLVEDDELIMTEDYLDQMREMLGTIHDEFAILYNAEDAEGFAMDIEYKITSDDQLIIKQARPWASFWSELEPVSVAVEEIAEVDMQYYPNPVGDVLNVSCDCEPVRLSIMNLMGQEISSAPLQTGYAEQKIATGNLPKGIYTIIGLGENGEVFFAEKFVKN